MEQEQTYSQDNSVAVTNRIRELEGKYNLIRDRVLIINNNMLEEYKKLISEIKVANSEIRDIKSEMFKIKESMKHIIKELEIFAKKDDVAYLEKYINIWNPMKFTTEEDVLKILERHKENKKEEKETHAKHR